MISRRDALRLSAAGILTSSVVLSGGPGASALAQELRGSVPMFRGNAARTGEMPGPAPDPLEQITVKWSFFTEGTGYYQPAVIDGTVYFGTQDSVETSAGQFFALDASSGQEIWRTRDQSVFGSSPTVAGDLVYFEDVFSINALHSRNGREKWSFGNNLLVTSPAVVDGVVYICINDGYFYALDASEGHELWRLSSGLVENSDLEVSPPGSSPAVHNGTLYISSVNEVLHAIDVTTGLERWRYTTESLQHISTPTVTDGLVFLATFGNLYAIDADSGDELWRYQINTATVPAVADGVVYIGSTDHNLYAIDVASGVGRILFTTQGPIFSSCAIVDQTVFFGSDDKNFYAVDAASGEELWRLVTKGPVRSSAAIVDGVVYVGSDDRSLYAIGNGLPSALTPIVGEDVVIRGAPSHTGVERGKADAGVEVTVIGPRESTDGKIWIQVAVDEVVGWIPLESMDPATLPPDGEIVQVHHPD